MPARNVEDWVAAAIESILASSLPAFELLIADDGSTDGTRAILDDYAARDPRIRLIDTHAAGPAVARNRLLALARGQYIAFQDSDDICHPDRLFLQREFLARNSSFAGVSCELVVISGDLTFPADLSNYEVMPRPAQAEVNAGKVFGKVLEYSFGASMIRAESLRVIGDIRPFFTGNEDVDFNLRLAETGKLGNLNQPLYAYRRHPMNTALRWPYTNIESGVLLRIFAARRRKGRPDNVYARKPNVLRIFTCGLRPTEIAVCLFEIARLSWKRRTRIMRAVRDRNWR